MRESSSLGISLRNTEIRCVFSSRLLVFSSFWYSSASSRERILHESVLYYLKVYAVSDSGFYPIFPTVFITTPSQPLLIKIALVLVDPLWLKTSSVSWILSKNEGASASTKTSLFLGIRSKTFSKQANMLRMQEICRTQSLLL